MKKNLYIIIATVCMLFVSCDKFLDVAPDNRTVLDNPTAVQELLVSAYPSGQYFHVCEVMSDNVGERNVSGTHSRAILNEEMYTWQEGFQAGTGHDTPFYLWRGCYNAIASANQALATIAAVSDPEKYTAQKGEALVCRAYAHFILVNMFAEHYDPNNANEMLGVPYVDEPEDIVIKYYKRSSVAEVYRRIEEDLLAGIVLIDDKAYSVPKYHFTKAAANAFAARYYLYTGNWDKVIEYANACLGSNYADKLLPLNTAAFMGISSDEYEAKYRTVEQPNILLLVGCPSSWGRDAGSSSLRYGMVAAQRVAIYTSPNVGGTNATYYRAWSSSSSGAYYMHKYFDYFKRSYPGSSTGTSHTMGAHFMLEDVLLMRAEAYAMKGAAYFDSAVNDIHTLLLKRVSGAYVPVTLSKINDFYLTGATAANYPDLSPFYNINEDQKGLLKCIVDWRQKEFMSDGLRWFDIKRFHLAVTHTFPNTNKYATMTLAPYDLRRALQIPMEAQAFGIEPNQRP